MHRRQLLRRTPALSALAIAGCAGDSPPAGDGGTPTDDTPTPTPTEPPETVELAEYHFEVTGRDSSGEGTADVEFDTETYEVRFTGTIQGKNGCQTAALQAIDYDREADEVTLSVRTKKAEGAGDACTQQLVYVDYEATVSFTGGIPSQASVVHDGQPIMSGAHDSARAGEGN